MSDPPKGRIAIKLGGGVSSSSSTFKSRPNQPPSALGKRPRHQAWGGGADDSDAESDSGHGKHESITGFGSEGAETEKRRRTEEPKKEYVIARQPNRDWRGPKRGRNPVPGGSNDTPTVETEPADQDKPELKWGLTIKETKKSQDEEEDSPEAIDDSSKAKGNDEEAADGPTPTRTADDEAMDALLGRAPTKPQAVIRSETDAYRQDVEEAGEVSTLADYEAMPVEEFGAALLRGMGWDGTDKGPKVKQVKRRPNKLGLGAKELKEAEDLGGWNQNGGKKRRPRLDEYRREENRRKERRNENSYRSDKDRDRERDRDGGRHRDRDRDYDRHRDRHRDHQHHHRDRR